VLDAWVLVLRCRPHASTGEQDLAAARRRADDHGMTTPPDDPRARFRELPRPVRPEELVETTDADGPVAAETPLETEWRVALLGPGTP